MFHHHSLLLLLNSKLTSLHAIMSRNTASGLDCICEHTTSHTSVLTCSAVWGDTLLLLLPLIYHYYEGVVHYYAIISPSYISYPLCNTQYTHTTHSHIILLLSMQTWSEQMQSEEEAKKPNHHDPRHSPKILRRPPPPISSESSLRSISREREKEGMSTPDLSPRSARIVTADFAPGQVAQVQRDLSILSSRGGG